MNSWQDTCYLVQFCYAQLVLPLLSSVCMIACRSQRRGKRTGHRGIQSTRRRLWDNCSRRKAVGRRGRQLQRIGPKIQKKTVSKAVAASENSSPKMKQCSFLFIRYGLCSHGPVTTFEVFFVFYFYFFPNCNGHPDDRVHVIFQKWLWFRTLEGFNISN